MKQEILKQVQHSQDRDAFVAFLKEEIWDLLDEVGESNDYNAAIAVTAREYKNTIRSLTPPERVDSKPLSFT
jgi:hypothetical protein